MKSVCQHVNYLTDGAGKKLSFGIMEVLAGKLGPEMKDLYMRYPSSAIVFFPAITIYIDPENIGTVRVSFWGVQGMDTIFKEVSSGGVAALRERWKGETGGWKRGKAGSRLVTLSRGYTARVKPA